MPKKNGIGSSMATPDKQESLELLLEYHQKVVNAILEKYNSPGKYYHIDMNAGNAFSGEGGNETSMCIFLGVSESLGLPYKAFFVEREQEHAKSLREMLQACEDTDSEVWECDNRDAIPLICKKIPHKALGLAYHDPNGCPDFELLEWMFKLPRMYKLDVLMRVNSTSIKRSRKAYPEEHPDTLIESLDKINKKYWLIKQLVPGDKWQWTFLFGTNWADLKDWRKRGFFRTTSPEGIEILRVLNLTAKEMDTKGQSTLLEDI